MLFPIRSLLFPLLLTALLTGCSQTAPVAKTPEEIPLRVGTQPDMSGHWEKNYQLSDDFNSRIALYIADIQRRYTTPQSRGDVQGIPFGSSLNNESIRGLARFAEELTRMPLLEIAQNDTDIQVKREADFTLRCHYEDRQYVQSTNAFGSDVCGWNDQRMLFRMGMGGGLDITHQFSLSPDGSMLDLTTTVNSAAVAVPLVIRNIYRRYANPDENYNCQLTLTRSTVCTQRKEPQ